MTPPADARARSSAGSRRCRSCRTPWTPARFRWFSSTAVVCQPITGLALVWSVGYALGEHWIVLSTVLYLVTGAFWLPVVWMQARMRTLATEAVAAGRPLPPAYHRLFRWWFAFGFPAFGAVAAIFWLMIARPPEIW